MDIATAVTKDLNILILGETGVGKSTWVNGFVNFLTFASLEEAEHGYPITLIPSEFTVCDSKFEQIRVSTGFDTNETLKAGQSATQNSRVHEFPAGNYTIRLIDTPGIGDTRGVEQDKKNFEDILSVLSQHDDIHGICILLKPNNARLNVMFRFCIKELLTYLHKDASRIILFCFTNTRGTFYKPGDTLPALRTLLEENKDVRIALHSDTMYCFDSEAYRFLVAIKNEPPVDFNENERESFVHSWNKSIAETLRMLAYIDSLRPHSVSNTISLNNARQLVLKLARPLAEITGMINTNKAILNQDLRDIMNTKATIEDLKKRKIVTTIGIEVIKIDYPKTVCSNDSCKKVWTQHGQTIFEYTQVCHQPCGLGNVEADSIGDARLMKCSAMGRTNHCNLCLHSYREHLHVYYDSKQVPRQEEDQAVSSSLKQKLSAQEMKQQMINSRKKQIEEYEFELSVIQKNSAVLGYFLRKNAITPYNDAIGEYIDYLIKEEKSKVSHGADSRTLLYLEESKASYAAQKTLLDEEMKKGGTSSKIPGPQDVAKLVEELQGLKHSGKTLTDALECIQHSKKAAHAQNLSSQRSVVPKEKLKHAKRAFKKFKNLFV